MFKQIFLFWLLISSSYFLKAQDIRIYHAAKGQSAIFFENDREINARWTDRVFIRPKGSSIEIVVLNPNPFFYGYDLKLEDFEIKEDFPDISGLLGLLNNLPEISKGPQAMLTAALGTPHLSPFLQYLKDVNLLMADIKAAKVAILASDEPESKRVALMMDTPDKGFRKAVLEINQLSSDKLRFNNSTLSDDLGNLLTAALSDPLLKSGISGTDAVNQQRAIEIYQQAFTLLNSQLVNTISTIKKSCKLEPVVRFVVPVTDKNQRVYLDIKKLDEKEAHLIRLEEKKLLCTIIPEFDRKVIELVPVVNLTHASGTPEFGVKDGVITQSQSDGYKFGVGGMLLINWLHFGKYNELAWGGGLGYAVSKVNTLDNFYLGTMLSYKSLYRIGFGAGFSSYPSGLKNNMQVGSALPGNIKDIQDIVDYKRTPSFFISFSISGLSILKK